MLPIARAGTLAGVGGLEEAAAVPGVDAVEITVPIGGRLRPVPEADRYLGFVFASGPKPDDVVNALKTAYSRLDIVIR